MLGDDIRQWRAANRIKQETLASMLGISRVAVSKWETNVSRPSSAMARRLAEIMTSFHKGNLAAELAFVAPRQQIKALTRGKSLQLIGISSGFRAAWPKMGELLGANMRPWLLNEARYYCEESDLLLEATKGEILMLTGVSNRLLSVGGEASKGLIYRWHTIVRRIDGELIHKMIFEPCARDMPTGFERVLRRCEVADTLP